MHYPILIPSQIIQRQAIRLQESTLEDSTLIVGSVFIIASISNNNYI